MSDQTTDNGNTEETPVAPVEVTPETPAEVAPETPTPNLEEPTEEQLKQAEEESLEAAEKLIEGEKEEPDPEATIENQEPQPEAPAEETAEDRQKARMKTLENINSEGVSFAEMQFVLQFLIGKMNQYRTVASRLPQGDIAQQIAMNKIDMIDHQASCVEQAMFESISPKLWKEVPSFGFWKKNLL